MDSLLQALTDALPAQMMAARQGRSVLRRAWWHCFKLVDPKTPFRVPFEAQRMWIDPQDIILSRCIAKHGLYEPAESAVMRALLPACRGFVDCGANIGYYTLLAAQAMPPSARIFAFEPEPHNFRLLTKNIAENALDERVQAFELGLGDRDGSADIYLESGNGGAHSLIAGNVEAVKARHSIRLCRLDDVVSAGIDAIKIDTQGAEPEILRGAAAILDRHQPFLMLEWWPWGLRSKGGARPLAELLRTHGYVAGLILAPGIVAPLDWQDLIARFHADDKDAGPTILCWTAARPLPATVPAASID